MKEEIILKSAENEYKATFDHTDLSKVFLDEEPHDVKVLKEYEDNVFVMSVNNKVYTVKVNDEERGKIQLLTTGFGYEFEVKTSTSALLEQFVRQSGKGSAADNGVVAPMPGMVVKIDCAVGDSVAEGDKIIIVEAMKMENALAAPTTGTIKKINAEEGKAVDKGAVLIEIE